MHTAFVFLLLLGLCFGANYTVYYSPDTGDFSIQQKYDPQNGVATATYSDDIYTTGWARLILETNPLINDDIQAYGAGYLEGYLTANAIWYSWYNFVESQFNGSLPHKLVNWLTKNSDWMDSEIKKHVHDSNPPDTYWHQVELTHKQEKGMLDGYNTAISQNSSSMTLSWIQFFAYVSTADLTEVCQVLWPDDKFTAFIRQKDNHCSVFVKVNSDFSDLLTGHTTWSDYNTMIRGFKQYTLNFNSAKKNHAPTTLFSSYPGYVFSTDDFYQLYPTNLVVVETTNGCFNQTALDDYVAPQNLFSWVRSVVANRMATSGDEWVEIFSKHNSGTYNNQWIIIDYSKFTPKQSLPTGVLWIAEQMPGKVLSFDATSYLEQGYWPSYNIPFFQENYEGCSFNVLEEYYGDGYSYQLAPRAQIFRRDIEKVQNIIDARNLLRYNNYKTDPFSLGDPANAVSSRFDLIPHNNTVDTYLPRSAFGGLDTKATNVEFVKQGKCYAQSGPSLGGALNNLPPFDWKAYPEVPHLGMPDVWNFPWVVMPQGTTE